MPKAALVGCPPSGAFKFAAPAQRGLEAPDLDEADAHDDLRQPVGDFHQVAVGLVPAGGRSPGGAEGRPRDPEQQADQPAREERATAGYDRRREDTPPNSTRQRERVNEDNYRPQERDKRDGQCPAVGKNLGQ